MSNPMNETEIAAAVEAGGRATDIDNRIEDWDELKGIPVVMTREGDVRVAADVLAAWEARLPAPRRRCGRIRVDDVDSLIALLKRWSNKDTIVFANIATVALEAVIDGHPASPEHDRAGWQEFRIGYACPRAPEWKAWVAQDGKAMTQEVFGDFIESRMEDIQDEAGYPKAVEMLELARNLNIHTQGTFQKTIDPRTGTGILINKQEHSSDSTQIPRAFKLGLRVFEGGDIFGVEARVRFALANGRPVFSFELHRKTEIERSAFDSVLDEVAKETGVLVVSGAP